MQTHILKYNPAFLTDDQLIANFAIRKADLDLLSINELDRALSLSQKAISLAPNEAGVLWTYSAILVRQGRLDDACHIIETALADAAGVDKEKTKWITLFIELAAKGGAPKALAVLRKSACAEILEPLVVALRLYVGENVKVAAEIKEIAKDVVERITSLAEHLKTDVSAITEQCRKLAKNNPTTNE